MDLNELKVLAGIKKDYPKENLSISGTEKSKLQTQIQDNMVYLQGPAEIVYQSHIKI